MFHYVYRLDSDSGDFYFGVRSSKNPFEKDRYMGSGVWCRQCRIDKVKLKKCMVSMHGTREEASEAELSYICKHWGNPKLMNLCRISSIPLFGPKSPQPNTRCNFMISKIWQLPTYTRVLWISMMSMADVTGLVWVHPAMLRKFSNITQDEFDESISVFLDLDLIQKFEECWAFKDVNYLP